MKKKLMFFIALVCFAPIYTSDSSFFILGDKRVCVFYEGKKTSTQNAYSLFKDHLKRVDLNVRKYYEIEKLTKESTQIIWTALNEFDYKRGELYCVWIQDNLPVSIQDGIMFLYVEITGPHSFEWYGLQVWKKQ